MRTEVIKQKTRYETFHDGTTRTISMPNSFREKVVYGVWFDGLDLNGNDVADVAAGSG
jgi:hypothetical protein